MRDNPDYCGEEPLDTDCPLCRIFFQGACIGCPIFEKTGEPFCRYTPYVRAVDLFYGPSADATWRAAANEEIEFLRSLLPTKDEEVLGC